VLINRMQVSIKYYCCSNAQGSASSINQTYIIDGTSYFEPLSWQPQMDVLIGWIS